LKDTLSLTARGSFFAVTALVRYLLGGEPADEMWEDIELSFSDVARDFWGYKYIALGVKGNRG
jgi:hypothetical protein